MFPQFLSGCDCIIEIPSNSSVHDLSSTFFPQWKQFCTRSEICSKFVNMHTTIKYSFDIMISPFLVKSSNTNENTNTNIFVNMHTAIRYSFDIMISTFLVQSLNTNKKLNKKLLNMHRVIKFSFNTMMISHVHCNPPIQIQTQI